MVVVSAGAGCTKQKHDAAAGHDRSGLRRIAHQRAHPELRAALEPASKRVQKDSSLRFPICGTFCIVQVAVIVQAPRLHDGVCHTDCRRLCVPGLRAALRCPSDRGEGEPPELHAAVLHYAGHLMLQAREVSRGLREEAVRYSRYSAIQKFSSPQQRLVNQLGCCVSVSPSFQLCLALVFQASWQREHH